MRQKALDYGIDTNREDAAILLGLLAAETHLQRAAIVLPKHEQPLAPPLNGAGNTDLSCSTQLAAAIRGLIAEAIQLKQPIIFAEIIAVLYKNKQVLPSDVLPDILSACYQYPELWAGLNRVLGKLGEWLTEQNPEWIYARSNFEHNNWDTATKAERLEFIKILRVREPQRAQDLLQNSWHTESTESKISFLKLIEKTLDISDEKIALEAFQHKRKDVRELGQKLLDKIKILKKEQKLTVAEKIKAWLSPSPEKIWLDALQRSDYAIYSDSPLLQQIEKNPTHIPQSVVVAILNKVPKWLQNAPTYSNKALDIVLLQTAILADNPKAALRELIANDEVFNNSRYFFILKTVNRAKRLLRFRVQLKENI